jgi:hypothetical protein
VIKITTGAPAGGVFDGAPAPWRLSCRELKEEKTRKELLNIGEFQYKL